MQEQQFGIDLGTTYSAIATLDADGRPFIVPNAEGKSTTPSIVYICPDGTTVAGESARLEMASDAENAARFFKRDMGTAITYTHRGSTWNPVKLSSRILRKLKEDAERHLQCDVRRCVITVPAYFHDGARVATAEAGRMAGLDVMEVINEPTAAALAYGLKGKSETVLVYDLGGGTFDVSLVRILPDTVEVLGTDGNHTLGGKDWDDRVAQYICGEFRRQYGIEPLDDPIAFQDILTRSEEAKKALSASFCAVVPVNCGGKMARIEITREMFESLTGDLLAQTETLVDRVLEGASFRRSDLSGVLLAGGSTLMPACRELVRRLTGHPPNTSVNPHECVALGAAVHAAGLGGATAAGIGLRVRDVVSHSLGMIALAVAGDRYMNSILIARNKPVPSRETRPYIAFTPAKGDNKLQIYVTQGESEDPADCAFVAKFVVRQIPPAPSGSQIIDISYEYDASGVVGVSATLRGETASLPVEKDRDLGDLSWVFAPPIRQGELASKTVYTAIDLSGSMCGAPLENAQKAVCAFVRNLDLAHTSVGLLLFADQVSVDCEACRDGPLLEKRVAAWTVGPVGFGNSADPFGEALRLLGGVQGDRFLVVLTDGVWSGAERAVKHAKQCHEAGIQVVAVGFGAADHDFLKRIASADESALFVSGGDLRSTFGEIAQILLENPGNELRLGRGGSGS